MDINRTQTEVKGFFHDFREFAMRGNAIDMAVGIVIGTAFGAISKSLVADVIMPPFGLLLGGRDFSKYFIVLKQGTPPGPYHSMTAAQAAHAVTLNYGSFIGTIITFIVISLSIFVLLRQMNKLKRKPQDVPASPTTKDCPHCCTSIPIKASRCPACTSELAVDS
ncbi:MAG TPA: large conductance mechanosensitive channel protein MscL [Gammaproteobacteria bacterium]|nr:large conductance mechanosensitive channel protein MscL [Gammaproteobacteria bacterium]